MVELTGWRRGVDRVGFGGFVKFWYAAGMRGEVVAVELFSVP